MTSVTRRAVRATAAVAGLAAAGSGLSGIAAAALPALPALPDALSGAAVTDAVATVLGEIPAAEDVLKAAPLEGIELPTVKPPAGVLPELPDPASLTEGAKAGVPAPAELLAPVVESGVVPAGLVEKASKLSPTDVVETAKGLVAQATSLDAITGNTLPV